MSKPRIVGYLALDETREPLWCDPDDGVLWRSTAGTGVTLFRTYDDARNAIKRTATHAQRRGYMWSVRDYKPRAVRGSY